MAMQPASEPSYAEALHRHVANEIFQKFALASFAIWTGSCLLLFILFAAGNARPVFPAMLSMTTPLIPAALIWVAYRPLVNRQVAKRLRAREASRPEATAPEATAPGATTPS
ncbi:MAG: hypothetical protein IT306_11385 [Chloroflexi bacterium]|nr:hypothetical protein [Chloroflexota bacterium]